MRKHVMCVSVSLCSVPCIHKYTSRKFPLYICMYHCWPASATHLFTQIWYSWDGTDLVGWSFTFLCVHVKVYTSSTKFEMDVYIPYVHSKFQIAQVR